MREILDDCEQDEQKILKQGALAAAGRANQRQTTTWCNGSEKMPDGLPAGNRVAEKIHSRRQGGQRTDLQIDIHVFKVKS